MNKTNIGWTNFSSNPLQYRYLDGKVVWACVHASAGCIHCYAEALALRYDRGKLFNAENMKEVEPFISEKEIHSILTYKPAAGKLCFIEDMSDLFGAWVPEELIVQIFAAMMLRDDVVFQVLTKRADRVLELMKSNDFESEVFVAMSEMGWQSNEELRNIAPQGENCIFPVEPVWPPANVWLGVSVEDQANADKRIPVLLQVPAAKRFVSYEPALGPVDFTKYLGIFEVVQNGSVICSHMQRMDCRAAMNKVENEKRHGWHMEARKHEGYRSLDWIIIGGESGHNARPFDIVWARSVLKQCANARVPAFMKQCGSAPYDSEIRASIDLDKDPHHYATGNTIKLKSFHGSDETEWEPGLRVREFIV